MSQALVISGTIKYGYDGEGRRISQKQGSTLTNYLWDEGSAYGDVLLETNGTGALGASYALAGGEVVAQTTSTGTSYLLHDKQGSTRAVSGTSGSIGESHVYDAYGSLKDVSGTPGTKYLYTGQQFDAPTGLYSLRARYYNTTLGQFLSRDTVNDGLNFYGYVHANPINRSDPSGHQAAYESAETTRALAVLTTAYVIGVGIAVYLVVDSIERTLSRAHVDAPTLPDLDNPPNEGKKPKQEPDDQTNPPKLPRSDQDKGKDCASGRLTCLYHYTNEEGFNGIRSSLYIYPGTNNEYGLGVYLTDLPPSGLLTRSEYSAALFGKPYVVDKVKYWILIDVTQETGLRRARGIYTNDIDPSRKSSVAAFGIFLVPGRGISIAGRVVAAGQTAFFRN